MPVLKNTWHSLEIEEVLKNLNTSARGLTFDEAEKRLKKYGPNQLPKEKPLSTFKIFMDQFRGPLVIVLVAAALISLFLGEFVDFAIIGAAILLNTIIGFVQEYKANRSLERLKSMIEPMAKVRRDGREVTIPSHKVVPGDILLLEAGSRIGADARLIDVHDFQTNEAALTGESLPIEKNIETLDKGVIVAERKNMVFLATTAVRGKAEAVVTGTGLKTELGKIATLIREIPEEKTPLQQKLLHFGKLLGVAVVILCFLIFFLGIIFGQSVFDMFLTAVAIAVAAIPEGLLVAVTIILAIGMQKILKKKALTRRLVAAETLGSVSIICSDKTGTLTKGEMHVSTVQTIDGAFKPPEIGKGRNFAGSGHALGLKIAYLCNDAYFDDPSQPAKSEILGEPTEVALFRAALEAGLDVQSISQDYPRKDEIPFDAERKYMATCHRVSEERDEIYIKGAPEVVLSFSNFYFTSGQIKKITPEIRQKLKQLIDELTSKGFRVISTAYRRCGTTRKLAEKDLNESIFVGFFGLSDPIRSEAKDTIQRCINAGIKPIMVTGDHLLTAISVARDVGIGIKKDNYLVGAQLDKMNDREFKRIVEHIDIYARVEPRHKVRIVDAWQERGEVVAMTGDGVNDAPALKSADVGVALGSGTDVAKETSDLVLLDNNFKTIVDAIHQGRVIFDNIRKIIVYLLSDSFSEMILIVGSLVARLPLPITAAQILWINLITDGLPNVALTVEPSERDVMKIPPRRRDEPLLNREMKTIIFIIGILTDIGLLGLFIYMLGIGKDIEYARTIVFTALGVDSLFYVFSCRSLRHTIFSLNPFGNRFLLAAVAGGFALQLVALYVPFFRELFGLQILHTMDWLLILAIGGIEILVIEITKLLFIFAWRRKQHAHAA